MSGRMPLVRDRHRLAAVLARELEGELVGRRVPLHAAGAHPALHAQVLAVVRRRARRGTRPSRSSRSRWSGCRRRPGTTTAAAISAAPTTKRRWFSIATAGRTGDPSGTRLPACKATAASPVSRRRRRRPPPLRAAPSPRRASMPRMNASSSATSGDRTSASTRAMASREVQPAPEEDAEGVLRAPGSAPASKPARRSPTRFTPRTVCVPSMIANGGTSRLVRESPRRMASRPMRTCWCTTQLPDTNAWSSDHDVPAEQRAAADDGAVADPAVVGDVRVRHEVVVGADDRQRARLRWRGGSRRARGSRCDRRCGARWARRDTPGPAARVRGRRRDGRRCPRRARVSPVRKACAITRVRGPMRTGPSITT